MKLILLLAALLLGGCGGGREGEDPEGWCDPGDQCPASVLHVEELGEYPEPNSGVRDRIVQVMTFAY